MPIFLNTQFLRSEHHFSKINLTIPEKYSFEETNSPPDKFNFLLERKTSKHEIHTNILEITFFLFFKIICQPSHHHPCFLFAKCDFFNLIATKIFKQVLNTHSVLCLWSHSSLTMVVIADLEVSPFFWEAKSLQEFPTNYSLH